MTTQNDLDRTLEAWFHGSATTTPPPEPLARAIEATRNTRPRPALVAWIGSAWIAAGGTNGVRGGIAGLRPALFVALVALLVLALAGGAVLVGSRLVSHPPVPSPFGLAGNGVIAVAKDGDILVADRPGGGLRPLVAGPEDDAQPMFSPDGTRLAFQRAEPGSFLMVADADGTNVVQVPLEPLPSVYQGRHIYNLSGWSFAPDGGSLMAVAQFAVEMRVVIRPVDPAAATTVLDIPLPFSWAEFEDPSFRPTNPHEILVVAEPDGQRGVYVYDLATGGLRTIVELADDQYVREVAWLPDGKHIVYTLGFEAHIVAADGSGDRVLDAMRADRLSPLSNDGTRIVIDVAEVDLPGDDSHQTSVVVPFDGEGERVELACGPGTEIECAWSWIWSPDDSMLIGTVPQWTSSDRETSLPDTYLQADPDTGQVTELDWVDLGTPAWQRVAP